MTNITVVVPVYRGARTIPDLTRTLADELPQLADAYELIFVEDNGGDDSWPVIQELAARYHWVRGYRLMRNYGQHAALLAGIRAARYEIVVTMDDDMQHPPSQIKHLLAKLDEGYDVVYGSPANKQHGIGRRAASSITRMALSSTMGAEAARHASAFRAFRLPLRDAFAGFNAPFVSIDALLTWGTSRFAHVLVEHHPRAHGQSTYTLKKLALHAITMMTGFSAVPLRLASMLGFLMTAFGFVLLVYIIGVRLILFGDDINSVPGFTFLASMISIFAGAQMFVLGIMGEYLARMHFRLMDRPPYIIGSSTDPDA